MRPYQEDVAIRHGRESRCKLLKGDVAHEVIQLAEVGRVMFTDDRKGCVRGTASSIDILLEEGEVLPRCDLGTYND